jgi:hypothetical protein
MEDALNKLELWNFEQDTLDLLGREDGSEL